MLSCNRKFGLNFCTCYLLLLAIFSTVCIPPTGAIDFYGAMHNFVKDCGKVLQDVSHGVSQLTQRIKRVERFLDATVDEDCYFECPPGISLKNYFDIHVKIHKMPVIFELN